MNEEISVLYAIEGPKACLIHVLEPAEMQKKGNARGVTGKMQGQTEEKLT